MKLRDCTGMEERLNMWRNLERTIKACEHIQVTSIGKRNIPQVERGPPHSMGP